MRLARNFEVSPGDLDEELARYPDAVAPPFRSARGGECYRLARRIALRAAEELDRFVASDETIRILLTRLTALDSSTPPPDLSVEAKQLADDRMARATEAEARFDEMTPDEFMGYLVRPRFAQVIQATLLIPPEQALVSSLVALRNLFIEIGSELVYRRLLRLRDRTLDDTGTVRPWPFHAGSVSCSGRRMTGPLERASPGAVRRLALAYGRAAAGGLPRPLPKPVRVILWGYRRYQQDTTNQALLARINGYAEDYHYHLERRRLAAERRVVMRRNPESRAALQRATQSSCVGIALWQATDPDVYEALDGAYENTEDSLGYHMLARAGRRCERILRWAAEMK
ncbi:unnamed protein product [Gemmata massiliana]|uniref:Uncharacterized protein n=1 Tax=Gemmata massiliana TaxID=1210884 RepID=A0A6P2D2G1_9BACT|nr:hypothetical protein [Gemmata massiliana]VTR95293.1 unnamed protein product [Gemmata massiliana]